MNLQKEDKVSDQNTCNVIVMDCANEIEQYQCKRCIFQTTVLTFMKQHWKNDCEYKLPEEVFYKCSKCYFLTHSRYLMLKHGLYSKCAETDDERKKLFVSYKVNNTENNSGYRDESSELPQNEHFESEFKNNIWQLGQAKDNLKPDNPNIRLQCEYCPCKLKNQQSLRRHIKYSHPKPEDIQWFECDLCSLKFNAKEKLNRHKRFVHASKGDNPWFKCEHCPSQFKLEKTLRNHLIIYHTDDKDISWFKCELCPLKFKTNQALKGHQMNRHASDESIELFKLQMRTRLKKIQSRTEPQTSHHKLSH